MPRSSRRRPGRPAGSQPGEGREALLQATRDLLAERGMPRVTVREVAERAGVQPALVNYYFGSKADLLRAVVEQVLFADDEIIDEFVDVFARANLAAVRSVLEAGRASGTLRPVDPLFFMPSAIGATVFFFLAEPIVRRLFGVEEITPELARRFAQATADLLLHGVAAKGAVK